MTHQTVHAWGFYDDDGKPRTPNGIAVSDLSVYHLHQKLARHITHFGGVVADLRVTRTLDGWLVATEFETPARGGCARMWHQITRAQDEWPDMPGDTEDPS